MLCFRDAHQSVRSVNLSACANAMASQSSENSEADVLSSSTSSHVDTDAVSGNLSELRFQPGELSRATSQWSSGDLQTRSGRSFLAQQLSEGPADGMRCIRTLRRHSRDLARTVSHSQARAADKLHAQVNCRNGRNQQQLLPALAKHSLCLCAVVQATLCMFTYCSR